jgi:UDP-N-acetylglucosamine--N-acetylmuramyl-(pentapeptide) pyrophosphoryl-undecaprenol N-acetylglucosamine transferase
MKAVLTGGGSGGHIFPLISVARELNSELDNTIDFLYVGPKDSFSREAFSKENIPINIISAGKIRRYFSVSSFFQNLFDLLINIPLGFIQSFLLLTDFKPDFIFSKGGYGSVPVVLIGRLLNIPIFLHESDAVPGLANRFIGYFAKRVFISFPQNDNSFPKEKVVLSGNPIRISMSINDRDKAKKIFGLKDGKPILLILGGSQGSKRINDSIIDNLDYLLEKFEIIHQTGKIDYDRVIKERDKKKGKEGFHVYDFFDENIMASALYCCDCVVSRAGSGSISEISAMGKPAILIPLPEAAQNHQAENARIYEETTKACIIIPEKNLSKENLFNSLQGVLQMKSEEILQKT